MQIESIGRYRRNLTLFISALVAFVVVLELWVSWRGEREHMSFLPGLVGSGVVLALFAIGWLVIRRVSVTHPVYRGAPPDTYVTTQGYQGEYFNTHGWFCLGEYGIIYQSPAEPHLFIPDRDILTLSLSKAQSGRLLALLTVTTPHGVITFHLNWYRRLEAALRRHYTTSTPTFANGRS